MSRIFTGLARTALVVGVVLMLGIAGCGGSATGGGGGGGGGGGKGGRQTKKLSDQDQARLDEARKSAEDAEKKLSDLRAERAELEGGR
jgi:hypothetical protein